MTLKPTLQLLTQNGWLNIKFTNKSGKHAAKYLPYVWKRRIFGSGWLMAREEETVVAMADLTCDYHPFVSEVSFFLRIDDVRCARSPNQNKILKTRSISGHTHLNVK